MQLLQQGFRRLATRSWPRVPLAKLGEPYGMDPASVAEAVLDAFTRQLAGEIKAVYMHLESMPAYTVSEILATS